MKMTFNEKGFVVVAGLFMALIIAVPVISYTTVDHVTVTVTDKERVVKRDDSYYLVFTETEVFKNEDAFLFFKFNSSDVQGKLRVGETYDVKVNGFRVPFMSAYRNILKVK